MQRKFLSTSENLSMLADGKIMEPRPLFHKQITSAIVIKIHSDSGQVVIDINNCTVMM